MHSRGSSPGGSDAGPFSPLIPGLSAGSGGGGGGVGGEHHAAAVVLPPAPSRRVDPELQLVSPSPNSSATAAAASPSAAVSTANTGEESVAEPAAAEGVAIDMPPLTSLSDVVVAAANSVTALATSPLFGGSGKTNDAEATPIPREPDGPLVAAPSPASRCGVTSPLVLLLLGLLLSCSLLALGYASTRSASGAASLAFGSDDLGRRELVQRHLLPPTLMSQQSGGPSIARHFAAAAAYHRARAERQQLQQHTHLGRASASTSLSSGTVPTLSDARPADESSGTSSAATSATTSTGAGEVVDVAEATKDAVLTSTSAAIERDQPVVAQDAESTAAAAEAEKTARGDFSAVAATAEAPTGANAVERQVASLPEGSTGASTGGASPESSRENAEPVSLSSVQSALASATGAATGDVGGEAASEISGTAAASGNDGASSPSPPTELSSDTGGGEAPSTPSIPSASSTGMSNLDVFLPDPPESFGSFLLVTAYGRESNRFLQVMESARWAVLTDRRLLHFPYDGASLAGMYDLDDLDVRMRATRLALARAPLPRDAALPLVLSYDRYLHEVLGLAVPDIATLEENHRDHCFAIRHIHCSQDELDSSSCIPRFAACHFSDIPFRDEPLQRLGPPSKEAEGDAARMLDEVRAWKEEKLLVLSGALLWDMGFPVLRAPNWPVLASPAAAAPLSEEQAALAKSLLSDLYPNLHPSLMSRAAAVLQRLAPSASAPSLALHIRTGDLREQVLSVSARMELALKIAREQWGLDLASTRIYIATDSDRPEEIEQMRAAFGAAAQIGGAQQLEAAAAGLSSPPVEPAVVAVLMDKALCVQADYFIGSEHSSYTMVIQMLRHRQPNFEPKHHTYI